MTVMGGSMARGRTATGGTATAMGDTTMVRVSRADGQHNDGNGQYDKAA